MFYFLAKKNSTQKLKKQSRKIGKEKKSQGGGKTRISPQNLKLT